MGYFLRSFLPPQATVANAYTSNQPQIGDERYVVIMFVDMRDSTKLAERRLPFDTVFVINRFLTGRSGRHAQPNPGRWNSWRCSDFAAAPQRGAGKR